MQENVYLPIISKREADTMNSIGNTTLEQLEEFNRNGFIRSNDDLMDIVRNSLRLDPNVKTFKTSTCSNGSTKYSAMSFFGMFNVRYFYDVNRIDGFIEHLYTLFYNTNPKPSLPLSKAFSKMLSSNYLIPKEFDTERLSL